MRIVLRRVAGARFLRPDAVRGLTGHGLKFVALRAEATVWSSSIKSFAKVFSQGTREVAGMIAWEKPDSFTDLAELAGRNKSNLSRMLKTMSCYGLVELRVRRRGTVIWRTPFDEVRLDVSLTSSAGEVACACRNRAAGRLAFD